MDKKNSMLSALDLDNEIELFYKALERHYNKPITHDRKRGRFSKLFTVNNLFLKIYKSKRNDQKNA